MTDNAKMVDLPWVDGTTRTVPEWTVYQTASGDVCAARDGGYSDGIDPKNSWGETIYPHAPHSAAVRIFTEAPEPPVKVNVPTSLGAIVSSQFNPRRPAFVLGQRGWSGIRFGVWFEASSIAYALRNGAVVLHEGVDEDTP